MWKKNNITIDIDDHYTQYVFAHKGTRELYEAQIYNEVYVFNQLERCNWRMSRFYIG